MSVRARNNVQVSGNGKRPMLFAHGFGCDQNMWRFVAPAFEEDHEVVLFDHVGAGKSDLTAYSKDKYANLKGYAADVSEIMEELDLRDTVFVGHSVSAMIGVLAAVDDPARFGALVLVGPSPRYIDDGDYTGGFTREQIEEMLEFLELNHLGWSAAMAPMIMGNEDRPELAEELTNSFCRTDPDIASHFARVTFTSDNRADVPKVQTRSLVIQCSDDAIAPVEVGKYTAEQLPNGEFCLIDAVGHCPNLSAPQATVDAIRQFLSRTETGGSVDA